MGTMAKVVFYIKNEETDKFKIKKSFTTMYDGLQGVAKEILKQVDGFENTNEPKTFIQNIISNYENYVKYDNKKTSNISEKDVDFCYKIYLEAENVKVSMSNFGKVIINKGTLEDLQNEIDKRLNEFNANMWSKSLRRPLWS